MQSGGTTIISSAFLRRPDTDGVLDTRDGRLPVLFHQSKYGIFHQKLCFNTIPNFTAKALCAAAKCTFGTEDVQWYLILRNPYHIIGSLKKKKWCGHWKQKLVQYIQHWEIAREAGTPIIRYEDFLNDYQQTMQELFVSLNIEPTMIDISIPIPQKDVYRYTPGNETYGKFQTELVDPTIHPLSKDDCAAILEICGTMLISERYV